MWVKARAPIYKGWERANTVEIGFAGEKGNTPLDVVWWQAALAEIAKASSKYFICVLWDIWKCYEKVDHSILIDSAKRHGYPLAILRITLASYRASRRLTLKGVVSRPIVAECGIVAGCGTATSELRCLLLDVLIQHRNAHPCVNLNIIVDDLSFDVLASSRHEAVSLLTNAAFDASHGLEACSGLKIARDKSAVSSSDFAAARVVRKALGDLGGKRASTVRALGVDFWAACSQRRRVMPVRSERWRKLGLRKPRFRSLSKSSKALGGKVLFVGPSRPYCTINPSRDYSDRRSKNFVGKQV